MRFIIKIWFLLKSYLRIFAEKYENFHFWCSKKFKWWKMLAKDKLSLKTSQFKINQVTSLKISYPDSKRVNILCWRSFFRCFSKLLRNISEWGLKNVSSLNPAVILSKNFTKIDNRILARKHEKETCARKEQIRTGVKAYFRPARADVTFS